MQTEDIKKKLLELLGESPRTFDELRDDFAEELGELRIAINEMTAELEVVTDRRGRLALPEILGLICGRIHIKRGGFGFVPNDEGDVLIRIRNLHGVFNGEKVLIKITKIVPDKAREGMVVRIEDKPFTIVGTVKRGRQGAILTPDDPMIPNIKLARKGRNGAMPGQKAVVEITQRGLAGAMPEGRVIELLGDADDKGVDILSIARSFGLKEEFPEAVQKYAASIPKDVEKASLSDRELLFDKLIFTIDGDDAKDLDDAVSLERLGNGSYILGVHIADVSHYVREDTAIDKEALKRSTSVYMVDRVVPMLPRELSNGICSLNEGVIRLTLSCFMKIDPSGNVLSHKIKKTAIRSAHRMTYNDVNKILSGDTKLCEKYADIRDTLLSMNELAHALREKRFAAGSLDFDIPEAKITLDEDNFPEKIALRTRGDAEKLIEEFMLICNETVAGEYESRGLPFLYRIHENPNPARMGELSDFLAAFGYKLPKGEKTPAYMVNDILSDAAKSSDYALISRVTLRSLKKARYSTVNEGHFGLASPCYCHFTSPIRRYPDLQIHRIIHDDIEGRLTKKRINDLEGRLPGVAAQTSERERNAIEAERRVDAVKMAEYMERHIGEDFSAIISGVASGAVFAQLDNMIEGVIPLSSVKSDYYELDTHRYLIKGLRSGNVIRMGDKVKVRCVAASKDDARVEFMLISGGKKPEKPADDAMKMHFEADDKSHNKAENGHSGKKKRRHGYRGGKKRVTKRK